MQLSHAVAKRCLSLACLATLCAGCSLAGGPRPADVSYDAARREINGPAEEYRSDVRQASYEQEQRTQERFGDEDAGFQLGDLKPSAVAEKVKKISGKGRDPDAAQELFERGDRLYEQALQAQGEERQRLLLEAAPLFEEAAKRWPGSTLEHDAMFRMGECFYFADHYVEANEAFEKLVSQYKNSRYLDAIDVRRFTLAQYWLEWERANPESFYELNVLDNKRPWRDTKGHALRLYDRIRLDDPTGKLADDATMAAANAYFLAGDYLKADMFYSDLRRTYPSSEHQFNAHFLGVQAKLLTYQGEDYSVTPLEEADKLVDQIRRQFPQEYAQNREEVDQAAGQVRKLKAERHWRMAEYFERRWEYGSARYYYDLIVKEFAGTPIAAEARQRLAALSDKPADPPQHFQWLADAFDAGKDRLAIPTKEEKAQQEVQR
ncbi:MAG: outer membrane protein assembly factor BamD [Planctomycetes bacterium]|nr:outer membrane protein assembly factor BamD [Planctomycetota bacterium]